MAGSTGVLVPPRGYLQRLRSLCDKHDLLLIFDEVGNLTVVCTPRMLR
eukprot:COSAG01_NODE_4073_length_5381_cov_3.511170_8_plen_48_part_00